MAKSYGDLRERLIANSVPSDDGDCWHWTGRYSNRYGRVNVYVRGKTETFLAHRLSYELWVGPIPAGYTVDHKCCDTSCINPAHLSAIPNAENASLSWRRGVRRRKTTH